MLWSDGRVARQSSAKARTAVRIRSGPPKLMDYSSNPFFIYKIFMRYSNYIGAVATIILIISCFTPWVYISPIQTIITGFSTEHTNFGKPGLMHVILSSFAFILFLLTKIGAKRVNVFVCALNFSWALRNYLLVSNCELGECPEKRFGIYAVVLLSFLMLIMSLLPKEKIK